MNRATRASLFWIGASALLAGCFSSVDDTPDSGPPPGIPPMERTCGATGETIRYTPWDWRFAGCTIFAGNVYADAPAGTADLLPLRGIKSVHGTLTVVDALDLKRLIGLEGLESVGQLTLGTNYRLVDLTALSSLRSASRVEWSHRD